MTQTAKAAASLRAHGIHCRRDPLRHTGWLAEIDLVQYCVGGNVIKEAAASADPLAVLEAACN